MKISSTTSNNSKIMYMQGKKIYAAGKASEEGYFRTNKSGADGQPELIGRKPGVPPLFRATFWNI